MIAEEICYNCGKPLTHDMPQYGPTGRTYCQDCAFPQSPHPVTIDPADPADAAVDIAVQGIMANSVKIVKMAQKDKWARELIRTMVQSDLW